jgi:hypothetical protein
MALLTSGWRGRGRRALCAVVAVWLAAFAAAVVRAEVAPNKEYQIKAVFLFNFAQFVEWPPRAFHDAHSPLVIGVLGEDPFGSYLDEAVRGEKIGDRPLVVRRYRRGDDLAGCHILFISRSEAGRLDPIVASLRGRSVLTVGEDDGFIREGGILRFVTENHKIRLKINMEAARAAGLTISSKLLRPALIVTAETDRD